MKHQPERTILKTVRFTELEASFIDANMKNCHYNSFSQFVRDRLIKNRVFVKSEQITDRNTSEQINQLSYQIAKIGNNYNQIARSINSLLSGSGSYENRTSNLLVVEKKLDDLLTLTRQLADIHRSIIKRVENNTEQW